MTVYHDNIKKYQAEISALDATLKELSALRLAVFLFSVITVVFLANARQGTLIFILAPLCVIAFGALVRRYNKADSKRQHATSLKEINEREVGRLENRLSDFPTGQTHNNVDHPYVSDLDIFGQHSVFQLLNRTTTGRGEALLAEWLSAPASKDIIMERQQAVKELSAKFDWRQHFQATGMKFQHTLNDYDGLSGWMAKPVQFLRHQSKYLLFVIPLSVLSTLAVAYFLVEVFLKGNLSGAIPLVIILLVNGLVLKSVRSVAEEILDNVQRDIKILSAYQSLIVKVASEKFDSDALLRLQGVLTRAHHCAAAEINKLKRILEVFQLRGRKRELNHQFYSAFNNLWFLDVYLIILTEKWKRKNGASVATWFSAINEFEVLSSLAGFHYSNPTSVFPEIADDSYHVEFKMLGHPLINVEKRVCNDFGLNGRGELMMITGSNMAGKSTFLRTVGVNMVLALTGAPCCATHAQVSNLKIFTSMRTQDSLEEGVSSFYAELRRIRQLLKLIESGQPIFFLLDEMFKGTNSKDRHRGGYSLMRQLKDLNAFGMISTHDLDLAILSGKHKIVTNCSFNSSIRGGEMIFNYILAEGLCSDFNASELMKRSGIKVLEDIEVNP